MGNGNGSIAQSQWTTEGLLAMAMALFGAATTQIAAATDYFGLAKAAGLAALGCVVIAVRRIIKLKGNT